MVTLRLTRTWLLAAMLSAACSRGQAPALAEARIGRSAEAPTQTIAARGSEAPSQAPVLPPGAPPVPEAASHDGWQDVAVAFPDARPWHEAFMHSAAFDGIKHVCSYLGQRRASDDPLVVGITGRSTPSGFRIDQAALLSRGHADEYQARCVIQWLTGAEQVFQGSGPERQYRFSYRFML
jgi:hypothetical protein